MKSFDPDLLRTLVAFSQTGSLSRAAEDVGRTASAVTAQMQRLEDSVGLPLFKVEGRGRLLTAAGERLVSYARTILALNNEAWHNVAGVGSDGEVRLGILQDFAEDIPGLLLEFARTYPRVRIDLRFARSAELTTLLRVGALDILVSLQRNMEFEEIAVVCEPMVWLCAREGLAVPDEELPLALLDPPCSFREAALAALKRDRRSYRIAVQSPSLSGLRAGVLAGIAVTVRTRRWLGSELCDASAHLCMPSLPVAVFSIQSNGHLSGPAAELAHLLRGSVAV